jgi:uncharacterized membrane protein YcaP (DUF421 family)
MQWLTTSAADLGRIAATGVIIFVVTLAYTRLVGLRSFAKMSNLDFASTIAIGSTMSSVILNPNTSITAGAVTLAVLFLLPWGINALRRRNDRWRSAVDNDPTFLMLDGQILQENLDREQVTMQDLRSKLRQAGVTDRSQVRAMVLETTGDFSVLTGDKPAEPWLLEGIDRSERSAIGGS